MFLKRVVSLTALAVVAGHAPGACSTTGVCDSDDTSNLMQTRQSIPEEDTTKPTKLCKGLKQSGVLSDLATDFYSTEEVEMVACNMAANIFEDGVVIASPAKGTEVIYAYPNGTEILQNNYYYMWQRDAGLTMRTLLRVGKQTPEVKEQLFAYARTLTQLWSQTDPNHDCWPHTNPWCSIYGEPKFYVNKSVFDQGWGRAQNDGPAINAMVLMDMLEDYEPPTALADEAKENIKNALSYVGSVISDSTVDPWEMLYGQHYFDQEIMQRAFAYGAIVAEKYKMTKDTNWHLYAEMMAVMVDAHWNNSAGAVRETLARPWFNLVGPKCLSSGIVGTSTEGPCELDVATLLGSLSSMPRTKKDGKLFPQALPPWDSKMLSTASFLIDSMGPTYEVNHIDDKADLPGILIGRYPGDEYDGVIMNPSNATNVCTGFNCGNPWFLTTHGMAEVMYQAAGASFRGELKRDSLSRPFLSTAVYLSKKPSERCKPSEPSQAKIPKCPIKLGEALIAAGDGLLQRSKHHAKKGMHMSEQIYRGNDKMPPLKVGQQVGVADLTWSYASLLDALAARAEVLKEGEAEAGRLGKTLGVK